MYYFAHLNPNTNICSYVSCSQNIPEFNLDHSIMLDPDSNTSSVLGKKWNGVDWEEVIEPEPEEPTA